MTPSSPESKWCSHHYESDCHGIDMLRNPDGSGKDLCAGGTEHPSRYKFCPWCGKPRPEPKSPSLAERLLDAYDRVVGDDDGWNRVADAAKAELIPSVEELAAWRAGRIFTSNYEEAVALRSWLLSRVE